MRNMLNNKVGAVLAGAFALVMLGGVGGAVAGSLVTSADIKNQTIRKVDIGHEAVGKGELRANSVGPVEFNDNAVDFIKSFAGQDGQDGADGRDGQDGKDGAPGAQGPAGKDGQNGTNGTNGTDGKDGVSGYEIHNAEVGPRVAGEDYFVQVNCPDGLVALGGGIQSDNSAGTDVTTTYPVYDASGVATGWAGTYDLTVRTNVKAWVTCAEMN